MIPKPLTGTYGLHLSNPQGSPIDLDIYLYDTIGRLQKETLSVIPGQSLYQLNYDQANSQQSQLQLIDTTPPPVPVMSSPANHSYQKPAGLLLRWDSVDDPSLPITYEYRSGEVSGKTTESQVDISQWSEGVHNWQIRACDAAANCSPWSQEWSFTLDSLAPILSTKTSYVGWYHTDQTAYFSFSDANLPSDYTDPSCQITTEGRGQKCEFTPNICDKAGNCNTEHITSNVIDLDKTPPTSTVTTATKLVSWDGKIAGTASDKLSGISEVRLIVTSPDNATKSMIATGTNNWSAMIDNPQTGDYIIQVTAKDYAGNVQLTPTSAKITFSPPQPSVPKMILAEGALQRIWMVWGPGMNAKKYQVWVGTNANSLRMKTETSNWYYVSEPLTPTTYYVGIKAVDGHGRASAMSQTIKVGIKKGSLGR